jgi:hypothetical protein
MKLEHSIYSSLPASNTKGGPRFASQEDIQTQLSGICENWKEYLQIYVDRTGRLFQEPERPWENTERAIVSTLSAAITRYYPNSIVLEESRVRKPGNNSQGEANDHQSWGRCDLWVSIQQAKMETSSFSFYLEAKTSHQTRSVEGLSKFLRGRYGIGKMFRDYIKSNKNRRVDQRSSYRKERKHEHYVIGLLVVPLDVHAIDFDEVKVGLNKAFENWLRIDLRKSARGPDKGLGRRMKRYPTVALILRDQDKKYPGMVASFTVLGATAHLTNECSSEDEAE